MPICSRSGVRTTPLLRPTVRRVAAIGAAPVLLAGLAAVLAAVASPAAGDATVHAAALTARSVTPSATVAPTTVTSTTQVAPTTVPTPAVAPVPVTAPSPPPAGPVTAAGAVRPEGQATAAGCGPALAYLAAYAAPGFQLVCPGDAEGHQAATCWSEAPCGPGQKMIVIADACPAAYMNEAHNSWVLSHEVIGTPVPDGNLTIDPYGYCHS